MRECGRDAVRCFVPPYMVERMARCADPRLRELALADLARCAAVRAVRAFAGQLPTLLAPPAPTARRQRLVYDAGGRDELPGTLVRSEGEDAVADRAVNEAFDHSGATFDFWLEVFGRRSLDDAGMTLISSVHVGEPAGGDRYQPLDNAFWDGRQMAYGDGDGIVFRGFTQALDVVAHELAHGVQAFTSNLVYRGQSGALNEHFADVFGTLVRQWHRGEREAGAADWLVGREVLVPAGTRRAIRDMEQPGTAYRDDPILGSDPQPAHMDGLYRGPADAGGVHINSGIPNRAFVLAAKSLGGPAWGRAGRIWHDCMLQLSRTSTFADMARLTAQVAGDRFDAATKRAVRAAWRRVGL